ncbi:LOW QUALITY PROTEIN: E3 ubiquitin-protein ligase RNF8-like isoform X1 [Vespula maculifrons]|uniref:E3 ubiquitin-protein ligase RNF8-like isoform X1 n=1 Tax=Vespula maculifrons TaxID=7453 RepID=A0ABD2C8A8_VESMC
MDTVSNIMDEQLTCSVCSELFIKATTLNCMHTFCFHCIDTWNKKRKECPVCRASVKSMNRSLVLDNFIEKMLDKLSMHMKDRRAEIVEEREGRKTVNIEYNFHLVFNIYFEQKKKNRKTLVMLQLLRTVMFITYVEICKTYLLRKCYENVFMLKTKKKKN